MADLLRLDEDIRDRIYKVLISEPTPPSFEISAPNGRYANYAAMLFTNRRLSEEFRSRLLSSRCHVIVSSNYAGFAETLTEHCVPVVSSKNLHRVAFHALRIHAQIPLNGKSSGSDQVKSSALLLDSALPEVALVLRCLSLTAQHPPGIPATSDGSEFKRISLKIRVMKPEGLPIKRQKELLSKLADVNPVGKITLQGVSPELHKMMPGHNEAIVPLPNETRLVYSFRKSMIFRDHRSRDGADIVKVSEWIRTSAQRAMDVGNFHLAAQRYLGLIHLLGTWVDVNPYVISPSIDCENAIDTELFYAGLGVSEAHFKAGEYEDAKHHIKPTVDDFKARRHLPKDRLKYALGLRERIDAALQLTTKEN